MTDKEKLIELIQEVTVEANNFGILPSTLRITNVFAEKIADHLIANGVAFSCLNSSGNSIPYEERRKVYTNALVHFGDRKQMIKCLEELAECSQAIAKVALGGENFDHMAEEIADATIMLEQMRMLFNINEKVCEYMDAKVRRLDLNLRTVSCDFEENRF